MLVTATALLTSLAPPTCPLQPVPVASWQCPLLPLLLSCSSALRWRDRAGDFLPLPSSAPPPVLLSLLDIQLQSWAQPELAPVLTPQGWQVLPTPGKLQVSLASILYLPRSGCWKDSRRTSGGQSPVNPQVSQLLHLLFILANWSPGHLVCGKQEMVSLGPEVLLFLLLLPPAAPSACNAGSLPASTGRILGTSCRQTHYLQYLWGQEVINNLWCQ